MTGRPDLQTFSHMPLDSLASQPHSNLIMTTGYDGNSAATMFGMGGLPGTTVLGPAYGQYQDRGLLSTTPLGFNQTGNYSFPWSCNVNHGIGFTAGLESYKSAHSLPQYWPSGNSEGFGSYAINNSAISYMPYLPILSTGAGDVSIFPQCQLPPIQQPQPVYHRIYDLQKDAKCVTGESLLMASSGAITTQPAANMIHQQQTQTLLATTGSLVATVLPKPMSQRPLEPKPIQPLTIKKSDGMDAGKLPINAPKSPVAISVGTVSSKRDNRCRIKAPKSPSKSPGIVVPAVKTAGFVCRKSADSGVKPRITSHSVSNILGNGPSENKSDQNDKTTRSLVHKNPVDRHKNQSALEERQPKLFKCAVTTTQSKHAVGIIRSDYNNVHINEAVNANVGISDETVLIDEEVAKSRPSVGIGDIIKGDTYVKNVRDEMVLIPEKSRREDRGRACADTRAGADDGSPSAAAPKGSFAIAEASVVPKRNNDLNNSIHAEEADVNEMSTACAAVRNDTIPAAANTAHVTDKPTNGSISTIAKPLTNSGRSAFVVNTNITNIDNHLSGHHNNKTAASPVTVETSTHATVTMTTAVIVAASNTSVMTSKRPGASVYSIFPSSPPVSSYSMAGQITTSLVGSSDRTNSSSCSSSSSSSSSSSLGSACSSPNPLPAYFQSCYSVSKASDFGAKDGRRVHATTFTPEVGTLPSVHSVTNAAITVKSPNSQRKDSYTQHRNRKSAYSLTNDAAKPCNSRSTKNNGGIDKCVRQRKITAASKDHRITAVVATTDCVNERNPFRATSPERVRENPSPVWYNNKPLAMTVPRVSAKGNVGTCPSNLSSEKPISESGVSEEQAINLSMNKKAVIGGATSAKACHDEVSLPSQAKLDSGCSGAAATVFDYSSTRTPPVAHSPAPCRSSGLISAKCHGNTGDTASESKIHPQTTSLKRHDDVSAPLFTGCDLRSKCKSPSDSGKDHNHYSSVSYGRNPAGRSGAKQKAAHGSGSTIPNAAAWSKIAGLSRNNKAKSVTKTKLPLSHTDHRPLASIHATERGYNNKTNETVTSSKAPSNVGAIPVGIAVARKREQHHSSKEKPSDSCKPVSVGGRENRERSESHEREDFLRQQKELLSPQNKQPSATTLRPELSSNLIVTGGNNSASNLFGWRDTDGRSHLAPPWPIQTSSAMAPTFWLGQGPYGMPSAVPVDPISMATPSGWKLAQDPMTGQLFIIPATNLDVFDPNRLWSSYATSGTSSIQPLMGQSPPDPARPPSTHSLVQKQNARDTKSASFPAATPLLSSAGITTPSDSNVESCAGLSTNPFLPRSLSMATGQSYPFTYQSNGVPLLCDQNLVNAQTPCLTPLLAEPMMQSRGTSPMVFMSNMSDASIDSASEDNACTAAIQRLSHNTISVQTSDLDSVKDSESQSSEDNLIVDVDEVDESPEEQEEELEVAAVDDVFEESDPKVGVEPEEDLIVADDNDGEEDTAAVDDSETMNVFNICDSKCDDNGDGVINVDCDKKTVIEQGDCADEVVTEKNLSVSVKEMEAGQPPVSSATCMESRMENDKTVIDDTRASFTNCSSPLSETANEEVARPRKLTLLETLVHVTSADLESEFCLDESDKPEDDRLIENSFKNLGSNLASVFKYPDNVFMSDNVFTSETETKHSISLPNCPEYTESSGLDLLSALAEHRRDELISPQRKSEASSSSFHSPDINRNYDCSLDRWDSMSSPGSVTRIRRESGPTSPFSFSGFSSDFDMNELEMRMKLAELQRRYKEKQKELAKLQPSRKDKDGLDSKRAAGRSNKRKLSKQSSKSSESKEVLTDDGKLQANIEPNIKKRKISTKTDGVENPEIKPKIALPKNLGKKKDAVQIASDPGQEQKKEKEFSEEQTTSHSVKETASNKHIKKEKICSDLKKITKGEKKKAKKLSPDLDNDDRGQKLFTTKSGESKGQFKSLPIVKTEPPSDTDSEESCMTLQELAGKVKRESQYLANSISSEVEYKCGLGLLAKYASHAPMIESPIRNFNISTQVRKRKKENKGDAHRSGSPVSKKRKPGCPQKLSSEKPSETETIVAKKPKNLGLQIQMDFVRKKEQQISLEVNDQAKIQKKNKLFASELKKKFHVLSDKKKKPKDNTDRKCDTEKLLKKDIVPVTKKEDDSLKVTVKVTEPKVIEKVNIAPSNEENVKLKSTAETKNTMHDNPIDQNKENKAKSNVNTCTNKKKSVVSSKSPDKKKVVSRPEKSLLKKSKNVRERTSTQSRDNVKHLKQSKKKDEVKHLTKDVSKPLKINTDLRLLPEEWNIRRSERIFLSDSSPQPSPNLAAKNHSPSRPCHRSDNNSPSKMKTSTSQKKKQPTLTKMQSWSQKVKKKYSKAMSNKGTKKYTLPEKFKYNEIYTDSDPDSDDDGSDNEPLILYKPTATIPGLKTCVLDKDDLKDGLRILYFLDDLFYEGEVKDIQPPDVYGVLIDGERGNRPHILPQQELLNEGVLDLKPTSRDHLPEGTRICAYWSQQFSCLYPGTVAKVSPNPDAKTDLINVEFDDGDSGKIPLDHIRMLPPDFPQCSSEPAVPLLLARRKKKRTTSDDLLSSEIKERKASLSDTLPGFNLDKIRKKCSKIKFMKCEKDPKDDSDSDGSSFEMANLSEQLESIATKEKRKTVKSESRESVSRESATVKRKSSPHKQSSPILSKSHFKNGSSFGLEKSMLKSDTSDDSGLNTSQQSLNWESSDDDDEAGINSVSDNVEVESDDDAFKKDRDRKSPKSGKRPLSSTKVQKSAARVKPELFPLLEFWTWNGKSTQRPGLKGKAKKVYYKAIQRGEEIIKVGDSAVFISTGRPHLPYVGRIENLWESWGGNMVVRVKWFYHPEETKGCGSKLTDPDDALFESSHGDDNDVQTISHRCEVLSYKEYRKRAVSDSDMTDVYYLAGYYDPVLSYATFRSQVSRM